MERRNHVRMLGMMLSLGIGAATPSFAKDVCVRFEGAGNVVFKKVKRLKPGGAVPLTGIWILGASTVPVSGTAIMRSDGAVRVGLQLFSMSPDGSGTNVNATISIAAADETYAGTGFYENEDDTGDTLPDGPATFTSIDCATVVLP